MTKGWIAQLAADERKRDDERARVMDAAARQADLVHIHGQRLMDDLRTTVGHDLDTVRDEFSADAAREITFEPLESDGGFTIRKSSHPTAALAVVPHLPAGSVICEYRFTSNNGMPSREDRVEFLLTGDATNTLRIKHKDSGQVFTTADALSEFLLVPVLTGRPR